MSRPGHRLQYYAEDKDVLDLLMARARSFDSATLTQLARRRGILLSSNTDREKLCAYLARLVWSWPQLQELLDLAEISPRAEKMTAAKVVSDAPLAEVNDAVKDVAEARQQKQGEHFNVTVQNGKVLVDVHYSEFDPSKTRLRQRIAKELTVEIEQTPDGFNVRHQANDRARQISAEVVRALEKTRKCQIEPREISLKGLASAKLRTEFFLKLMTGMPGFKLQSVTAAHTNRLGETEEHPVDDDDPSSEGPSTEDQIMLGVVRRVALEGDSLLASREFLNLKKDGFFLSRVVWRSREEKPDPIELEFEADFENPNECKGFRYNVRGVYERRTRGEDGIKKSRAAVPPALRTELMRKLESSAHAALDAVEQLAVGEPNDEQE
jgi:hypothetical protein